MLPASRTEWLSGRTKYEMTSITASTIRSATVGALATQNRFRKCGPCFMKPITVTVMKTASARIAVTAMCEVEAKLPGISASRLANRMNRKSVMM